jgi:hypothetical protein
MSLQEVVVKSYVKLKLALRRKDWIMSHPRRRAVTYTFHIAKEALTTPPNFEKSNFQKCKKFFRKLHFNFITMSNKGGIINYKITDGHMTGDYGLV